ncbi:MAG: fuculose phosphate aldolase [Acidimicrobiaceae bacterium]|nr:class II aldolase/adducin family protein [Acidimicrobiaceae bacterium]MXW60411.1 fuculose phosphate aldolase [Acidimicrobiaceae bacterium]MYC41386.1 fuculose phosphate aldolase [Acidimicrobiaceae bacterium]MYH89168.1 fuculose phosphate aldolase [Acidimicrobiaceae bacterium]
MSDDPDDSELRRAVRQTAMRMYDIGLVVGTAGNVSGRGSDGSIIMTPSSVPYPEIGPDNLAVVSLDGETVSGSASPSSEKAMHLACYNAFPEVGGVVHCHPPYGSMFALAREPIPVCIEEGIVYVGGDIPLAEYRMTGSDELAAEVVRHLADRGAVLMANHGLLCVGHSPQDALHTAEVVEHTARVAHGAEALGGVVPLPAEIVESFANVYRLIRSRW